MSLLSPRGPRQKTHKPQRPHPSCRRDPPPAPGDSPRTTRHTVRLWFCFRPSVTAVSDHRLRAGHRLREGGGFITSLCATQAHLPGNFSVNRCQRGLPSERKDAETTGGWVGFGAQSGRKCSDQT